MDVSILQHSRDSSPQTVSISQVASQIRGGTWPPGYQPLLLVQGVYEGGVRQQDITRLSGLSVAVFSGVDDSSMAELREEACADPHTLLLYAVADSLVVIYPYELDIGYELYLQLQFYHKAFLYGNDYYEHLFDGRQSVRKGKYVGKRCTLAPDAAVYYNPQAEPFLAWEIKEGCRRQTSRPKSTEGLRERKPNYREEVMTQQEIEDWLTGHIELRRNVVTLRREYRWTDNDGVPHSQEAWQNFTDETLNTLWRRMEHVKHLESRFIRMTVESDFVADFNPFRHYLDSLPPWDGDDHLNVLAASVTVAGGMDGWLVFRHCLTKWIVGMIAGWLNASTVNHMVLVFIGAQGIYKTSWMNALLPPTLRSYFSTRTNVHKSDRDARLKMAQYGLICCEELDTMTKSEMNTLKGDITTAFIDERPAYGRYTEHLPHIASFCGTGNNMKFLNDPTGTRRWLAFEVKQILSPYEFPFDYQGIYSQAYHLYRNGFNYYFSKEEGDQLSLRNKRFSVPNMEELLVSRHFGKPASANSGRFIDVATALKIISDNISQKLHEDAVAAAFEKLGFVEQTVDGIPGYTVVVRDAGEMKARESLMATRAAQGQEDDDEKP